ncbi:MAG: HNH endonuclease domain-containing protein [Mariprofundaceae bacterium]
MGYRLGIDLGTASIGVARIALNHEGEPVALEAEGLIFEEPLEPAKQGGVGAPKKAIRREKRSARRLLARRKRDLRWIRRLYPALGISDADMNDEDILESNQVANIHELRVRAAREPVTMPALIRVLGKMKKRRGYRGRFRESSHPGEVQAGIMQLREAMEAAGCETLGEYLFWRHRHGLTLKLKEAEPKLYVHRSMVEEEFERIWQVQSRHHEALQGDYDGRPWRNWLHDYVFHQRPLRSPAPMVGHCELEPSLPRAPRAQPLFQDFRIEKTLNDLAWSDGTPLDQRARELIRGMLHDPAALDTHGVLSFKKIYHALDKLGLIPAEGLYLNLHEPPRTGLKGDTTRKAIHKLGLLDDWDALDAKVQVQVINLLADMGSPEVFEDPDWASNLRSPSGKPRRLHAATVHFIDALVAHPRFGRLSAMGMDAGRAQYSLKAMARLLPLLREGLGESEAKDRAYPEWRRRKGEARPLKKQLAPHPATGNVSVDCALRNLRREINRIIERYGPPDEIIVEMTRDMRLGRGKRAEIARRIAANERARKKIARELETHGYPATRSNILRYQLWEEQDHRCPYCDERGISLDDAMSGQVTNYEHIIPFQLTRVGRQRGKLVLAHRGCNDAKGDRTPWQAWGHTDRWKVIEARAEAFAAKKLYGKARQLLLKDFEEEVLTDEAIEDFSERQYHESGWIAKLALAWLKDVCPRVFVSRGMLTAHLRRIWGLDTVIPEVRFAEGLPVLDEDGNALSPEDLHGRETRTDKRLDHRHHLIDAIVIGLSTPGLFNRMARHYKRMSAHSGPGEPVRLRLRVEPPMSDLRERVKAIIEACPIRHKPDRYPDGQIFEDTAYRLIEVEENGEIVRKLASRKRLADAGGAGSNESGIRRFVESIAYPETRRAVAEAVEERLARGVKPAHVFDEPIPHPRFGTPIRRVFCFTDQPGQFVAVQTRKDIPAEALQRSPNAWRKHLKHAGNAYLEIDQAAGKVRLVTVLEALREKGRPAPAGVLRIYKGDTINHPNGRRYVVRQIKSKTKKKKDRLVCTLLSETRNADDLATPCVTEIQGRTLMKIQVVNE